MLENINLKIVAGTAIGAFLIAFISAGIGGVGFGTMLLRGFLGALIFSILGAGASLVISRYIPELLSGDNNSNFEGNEEAERTGRNVNVVSEESDVGEGLYNLENAEEESLSEETQEDFEEEEVSELESVEEPSGEEAAESLERESEEDSLVEEVEEIQPADQDEETAREESSEVSSEDLDRLPDMDRFAGTFEEEVENEEESSSQKNQAPEIDNTALDQDPETMAKAIRTALKRDSES
jgi:hypothetical protein